MHWHTIINSYGNVCMCCMYIYLLCVWMSVCIRMVECAKKFAAIASWAFVWVLMLPVVYVVASLSQRAQVPSTWALVHQVVDHHTMYQQW